MISFKACSLSTGVVLAILFALLIILAMLGVGTELVASWSTLLIGYEGSFPGLVVGAFWGFLIGVIAGGIYAFFYNKMV